MTGIATLLLAAAIAFGITRWTRLPTIPLLLLGGIVLQSLARWRGVDIPQEIFSEKIEIGLAVLVFVAGIDLSPRRMHGKVRPIVTLACCQFAFLGLIGFAAAFGLGYDLSTSLYLSCALAASSTLVVVNQLQRRRQMFEPYGRLVLGVLLLQDFFIIFLMVVLLKAPDGAMATLEGLGGMLLLGALAWGIHHWGVPRVCARFALDPEELLIGALALLFLFGGLAHFLKLPFVVGAFLAGFALSAFPMNGLVRGMLASLSSFFLSLFFLGIGMILVYPGTEMLLHGLIFIVVLVVATILLVTVVGEKLGYSTRASLESGLLLSQTSEFSLVIALSGMAAGSISPEFFSLIALITVGTMTITPWIAREKVAWTLMKLHPRYRAGETLTAKLKDHVVILGLGHSGRRLMKLFQEQGVPVVVIDDDAAVIRRLIEEAVPCIQGDGSDPRMLERAYAPKARLVICSMRRPRDALTAIEYLKGTSAKVMVRVFDEEDRKMIEPLGALVIPSAEAAADQFLEWFAANPMDNGENLLTRG